MVGEPGWKVVTAYDFTEESGTVTFAKGRLRLDTTWYPADQYDAYEKNRLEDSSPTTVTVDGWKGSLFATKRSSFTVMLHPHDGIFVEFSTTSDGWNRAEFDRVRALLRRVDTATWFAAMPPGIVTPDRADGEAAKMLADVPRPPGLDLSPLDRLGANDLYQFGARVTSLVGCAWIAEWVRADNAGDRAARARAAAALRGSRQWKVLQRMAPEGGQPEVLWDVAEDTAAGGPPAGYRDTIGCA